jgi:predicted CXXCH cytochrome family protein
MKGLKLLFIILGAGVLTVGLAGFCEAQTFHSGGVANCEGCHSMHSPAAGGTLLLIGGTQSETCLNCHEQAGDTGPTSYHVSTATADMVQGTGPRQRTPGGDFGWLRKTYTWLSGTTAEIEDGATHGHNIIAPVNGYNVDPVNTTAPGGTFTSSQLACISCHDPHGQYRRQLDGTISRAGAPIWASGSYSGAAVADNEPKSTGEAVGVYRLLAGAGYTKSTVTFTGNPSAKVPSVYNRTEISTQTRTAYGNASTVGHISWGFWCATCHPNMHSSSNYVHPTDEPLGSLVATTYNQYVKSGDLTGSVSSSYLSLVPFIEASGDYTVLAGHAKNDNTQLGGPVSTDRVSCLSCHRAHASGFVHMLRFDLGFEFTVINGNYPGIDHPDFASWGSEGPARARGRTMVEWQAAYYDRTPGTFATFQRVLCNKCHAKD